MKATASLVIALIALSLSSAPAIAGTPRAKHPTPAPLAKHEDPRRAAPPIPVPLVPRCETATPPLMETDRFTGTTTIRTPFDADRWAAGPRTVPLAYLLAVRVPSLLRSYVPHVTLTFAASGDPLGDCSTLRFLLDGAPYTPPSLAGYADPKTGLPTVSARHSPSLGVTTISAPVTLDELARLLSAGKIEYQVCTGEYTLSAEDVCNAREFYWALRDVI